MDLGRALLSLSLENIRVCLQETPHLLAICPEAWKVSCMPCLLPRSGSLERSLQYALGHSHTHSSKVLTHTSLGSPEHWGLVNLTTA